MKTRILQGFAFALLIAVLLASCAKEDEGQTESSLDLASSASFSEGEEKTPIDRQLAERVEAGMTIKTVLAILGPFHYDFQSVLYPFCLSWQLEDERMLSIAFYIDGCETQADFVDLKNALYGDELSAVMQGETDGKEVRERMAKWVMETAELTSAWISEGGMKTEVVSFEPVSRPEESESTADGQLADCIQMGMPMKTVLEILGPYYHIYASERYPFGLMWYLDDSRHMYIDFIIEGIASDEEYLKLSNAVFAICGGKEVPGRVPMWVEEIAVVFDIWISEPKKKPTEP